MQGKLFLIPTVLNAEAFHVIPSYVNDITNDLRHFFVENEKTARRYLRKSGYTKSFDEVVMLPLNEHTAEAEYNSYLSYLSDGNNCGLLSEAGVPAVADPGSGFIRLCHIRDIQVVPLCGPSSIILALMASGLNGQQFCFNGYLPVKQPERIQRIRMLETKAKKGETQIFIETPYRNNAVVQDVISACSDQTYFCIARDLTGVNENIQTMTIAEWKRKKPKFDKVPAIFLIG